MGLRTKVLLPLVLAIFLLVFATAAEGSPVNGAAALLRGLLLLLMLITAWNIRSLVLRPVGELKEMAQKLARREVDRPLPAVPSGELDDMARSLGQLRDLIREDDTRLAQAARQHKDLEQALREVQETYVLAVERANDGIWEWNLKTDTMYLSPRWKSMLGYLDEEISDSVEGWKRYLHPEDRGKVGAALEAHLEGATLRFESEHRVLHKDGGHRWLLSRATAIRHASGNPYRVVGLDADITQFKRLEEILVHLAEGTSGVTGGEFFRSLVKHFAGSLGVRVAFVTECMNHPTTRVRALAFWSNGEFLNDVEYDLEGTPCDKVINEGIACFHPKNLAVDFPKEASLGLESYFGVPIRDPSGRVLGHLAFLDDREMDDSILLASIYKIFTARAAAELERKQVQKAILDLAKSLSEVTGDECLGLLVKNFASLTGVREAFVTECIEHPVKRLRVLAWWRDGAFAPGDEYDLAGSVCEETITAGRVCFYSRGVGERFPPARAYDREAYLGVPCFDSAGRVIGHVACVDNKPIDKELPDEAILRLFAVRAGVELERRMLARDSQVAASAA